MAQELTLKVLLIGDSSVGKTCLMLQFAKQAFSPTFISTIGIDFKFRDIVIDHQPIKMQIWDTAGQERFRTITTSYFHGVDGIMLVFDVCDRATLANVDYWKNQILAHADKQVSIVLIANKIDEVVKRQTTRDEGVAVSESIVSSESAVQSLQKPVPYFETSAKTGVGVDEAFIGLAKEIMVRKRGEGRKAATATVDLAAKPPKDSKCSC